MCEMEKPGTRNATEFSFIGRPRRVVTRERDGIYHESGDLELGSSSVTWDRTFDENGRPMEWKFFERSVLTSVLEYHYEGEECTVTETNAQGAVVGMTKQKPFTVTTQENREVQLPERVPVLGEVAKLEDQFEFDGTGNWIRRTTTAGVGPAKVVHIEEREITYW
jgi:hypothetical protein